MIYTDKEILSHPLYPEIQQLTNMGGLSVLIHLIQRYCEVENCEIELYYTRLQQMAMEEL